MPPEDGARIEAKLRKIEATIAHLQSGSNSFSR